MGKFHKKMVMVIAPREKRNQRARRCTCHRPCSCCGRAAGAASSLLLTSSSPPLLLLPLPSIYWVTVQNLGLNFGAGGVITAVSESRFTLQTVQTTPAPRTAAARFTSATGISCRAGTCGGSMAGGSMAALGAAMTCCCSPAPTSASGWPSTRIDVPSQVIEGMSVFAGTLQWRLGAVLAAARAVHSRARSERAHQ